MENKNLNNEIREFISGELKKDNGECGSVGQYLEMIDEWSCDITSEMYNVICWVHELRRDGSLKASDKNMDDMIACLRKIMLAAEKIKHFAYGGCSAAFMRYDKRVRRAALKQALAANDDEDR